MCCGDANNCLSNATNLTQPVCSQPTSSERACSSLPRPYKRRTRAGKPMARTRPASGLGAGSPTRPSNGVFPKKFLVNYRFPPPRSIAPVLRWRPRVQPDYLGASQCLTANRWIPGSCRVGQGGLATKTHRRRKNLRWVNEPSRFPKAFPCEASEFLGFAEVPSGLEVRHPSVGLRRSGLTHPTKTERSFPKRSWLRPVASAGPAPSQPEQDHRHAG